MSFPEQPLTAVPDPPPDDPPYVIHEPGVYLDVPFADYLGDPVPEQSLSSSGARKILPPQGSLEKFRYWADNPEPPSDTFDEGSAGHRMVLGVGHELVPIEPHTTKTGRVVEDWNTNEIKGEVAAIRAAGAIPLKRSTYDRVTAMARRLASDPDAGPLLAPGAGQVEASLFWRDGETDVMRRARIDYLREPMDGRRLLIVDYKTCLRADPVSIRKAISEHGYHLQLDWYDAAVTALELTDEPPALAIVFQEKTAPYAVTVAYPDPEAMRWARRLNRYAIRRYADAMDSGQWPGYVDRPYEAPLPPWEINRLDDEFAAGVYGADSWGDL